MAGAQGTTREQLIQAALTELFEVGQAEFTMEGVAQRAYFSIGAVYSYWPDRATLIGELARVPIADQLRAGLAGVDSTESAISWAFDTGRNTLVLVGEILIAGHSEEGVAEPARQLWRHLIDGLELHLPSSMAWYVAMSSLGVAMLDIIGLPGPQPPTGRTPWLVDACGEEERDLRLARAVAGPLEFTVPTVPPPMRADATTVALIQAAKSILTNAGTEGASTRSIASAAGVTTGAVYRRYKAKSQLFADVLLVELSPDRYSWTWDLVSALASDDPYQNAADVITVELMRRYEDVTSQKVLLQLGVAARNDEVLRSHVHQRIAVADRARREMFAHFIAVGLIRDDVDPAVFAWGFQAIPIGVRLTLPLGITLEEPIVATAMKAILMSSACAEQPVR